MWYEAMKLKGHMPIMDEDGDLDCWVTNYDIHNGPGCAVCGWTCCEHCDSIDDIPECTVMTIDMKSKRI